jgi:hypothetical protein
MLSSTLEHPQEAPGAFHLYFYNILGCLDYNVDLVWKVSAKKREIDYGSRVFGTNLTTVILYAYS